MAEVTDPDLSIGPVAAPYSWSTDHWVLSSLPVGVVVHAGDGRIMRCNAAAERILGLSESQMLGLASTDASFRAVHEDETTFPGEAHPAMVALRTGEPVTGVVMGVTKPDGTRTWIQVNAVPIAVDAQRSAPAVIATFADITEQKRLKRLATAAEEHYRLLAENASDVVARSTADGIITWVSPSVSALLGWMPGELVGRSVFEFLHPEDLPSILAAQSRLGTGAPVNHEGRLRTASGCYRWVASHLQPVLDPSGAVVGRIAGWRDIQTEHDAREARAEAEARYRLLAENASDVVCAAGADRLVTWVSPAVTSALGWAPEDLHRHGDGRPDPPCRPGCHRGGRDEPLCQVHGGAPPGRLDRPHAHQHDRVSLDVGQDHGAGWGHGRRRQGGRRADERRRPTGSGTGWRTSPIRRKWRPREARAEIHAGGHPVRTLRVREPNGTHHWVQIVGGLMADGTGAGRGIVASIRLVDDQVALERELAHRARHDPLTGLLNRDEAHSRLSAMLGHEARAGGRIAVVYADLDNLKEINDGLGHGAGDEALRSLADRLRALARSDDVVARVGGDGFLVILDGVRDLADAQALAVSMVESARVPVPVWGGSFTVSLSVGITRAEPGETCEEVIGRADRAMYEAKRRGRDQVVAVPAVP
ncbi:MAG TPA: sensor domain-containing diguanylate cyclase [Candidatus Nanopelagicales bacterium]